MASGTVPFQIDADKQGPPEPAQDLLLRLPAGGAAPGQERQRPLLGV